MAHELQVMALLVSCQILVMFLGVVPGCRRAPAAHGSIASWRPLRRRPQVALQPVARRRGRI
jgi:hypothetical protein